jgi:hypothetical protein
MPTLAASIVVSCDVVTLREPRACVPVSSSDKAAVVEAVLATTPERENSPAVHGHTYAPNLRRQSPKQLYHSRNCSVARNSWVPVVVGEAVGRSDALALDNGPGRRSRSLLKTKYSKSCARHGLDEMVNGARTPSTGEGHVVEGLSDHS